MCAYPHLLVSRLFYEACRDLGSQLTSRNVHVEACRPRVVYVTTPSLPGLIGAAQCSDSLIRPSSGPHTPASVSPAPEPGLSGKVNRMILRNQIATALALSAAAFGVAACGDDDRGSEKAGQGLPQGGEKVELDPADFTTQIDNPYWPMAPGSRWVYRETDSEGTRQRVVVTVTRKTKMIANGIEARVVRDVVTEGGAPVEVTDDWYAQDGDGNIWYLGEDTTEYENGKPKTTAGSFEAGVDGAEAGIIMPADPAPGTTYRQEYYAGEAEDTGEIISGGEQAEVPFGHFEDVLMTKDLNPLEPKILEFKFYARDVGPVLAISVSGGSDREELLSFSPGK
jgi:hypothetical protein